MSDNKALKDYLNSLPYSKHTEIISKIMSACGVSRIIVSNWKNTAQRIPPLAKMAIEEIACKKIFPAYERPAVSMKVLS